MKVWFVMMILLFTAVSAYGEEYFSCSDLVGVWTNNDKDTRGLTKLVVTRQESSFTLRAFGKCEPFDCDWGLSVIPTSSTIPIDVFFDNEFKTTSLKIEFLSKSSIYIDAVNIFKDADRNYNANYYLYLTNDYLEK